MRYPDNKSVKTYGPGWHFNEDKVIWRSPIDANTMDEKALIGITFPNSRKDDLYKSVYDINVHYRDGPLSIPHEVFQAVIIACLITSYRRPNLKNGTESAGSTLVKSVNAGDPSEKQGFRDDTPYYLGKVLIEYPFTGFYRKTP